MTTLGVCVFPFLCTFLYISHKKYCYQKKTNRNRGIKIIFMKSLLGVQTRRHLLCHLFIYFWASIGSSSLSLSQFQSHSLFFFFSYQCVSRVFKSLIFSSRASVFYTYLSINSLFWAKK